MRRGSASRTAIAAAALAIAAASPAGSQELRIALGVLARSIDPHFANVATDQAQSLHLFDRLIMQDENQRLYPGLATAWRVVGEKVWELDLREGVRFHDGSPFTAQDVEFTVGRAGDVPNATAPLSVYTRTIERIEILGPHRVRVHTKQPAPLLPWDLSTFSIVSKRVGEGATTADYNSGKAAIGTGPYRFVEYVPDDRIVVARNDDWWGGREPWGRVAFRRIANPAVRSAALLARDVDVIERVPSQDLARLEVSPDVAVWRTPSYRVMYLLLDSYRDVPLNNLRDLEGRPLATNPLRDRRVRLALSRAIARDTLTERVMEGLGVPAGQLVPPALFGHDPTITAPTQDVALARQLLAEAGWGNGFQMTLHSASGLWPNDARAAQTIAQMFTRLGLQVNVEAVPPQMYSTRATNFEFSVAFYGWGTDTGEAGAALRGLVQTRDNAAGTGPSNRGRYSNPALDALIDRARGTFDNAAREALYQEAMRMAMDDVAVIPLYFPIGTWATRGGIRFVPRLDEFTLAMSARPR